MSDIAYSIKEVARARHRALTELEEVHRWMLIHKPDYRFTRAYKERVRKIESYYRYDLAKYLEWGIKTRKTHNYVHSPLEKVVKEVGSGGYILLPKSWVGRTVKVELMSEMGEHGKQ